MTAFLKVAGVIFIVGGLLMLVVGGSMDAEFHVPGRHYVIIPPSGPSLDLSWLVTALLGAGMVCTGPVLLGLAAILDSLPDRGTAENRPAGPADV